MIPKVVKKVIANLDLPKLSGPDCIPVKVLKNCELELFYMPAELFNKCLKESFFQIVGRFYRWSLYSRMLGKDLVKVLVKSYFQYGFRSSRSTGDLLTVASDRITRAFHRSVATRAAALDISKAFVRVWHAGLLHKRKS